MEKRRIREFVFTPQDTKLSRTKLSTTIGESRVPVNLNLALKPAQLDYTLNFGNSKDSNVNSKETDEHVGEFERFEQNEGHVSATNKLYFELQEFERVESDVERT